MADWSALVKGFQEGGDFAQRFRANRQFEKARDLALEGEDYDMQARRANRRIRDPLSQGVFGKLDPNSVQDYSGQLQDPFAFKLFDFIKSKAKKKKQAVSTGQIAPTDSVAQTAAPEMNPYDAASPPQQAIPTEDEFGGYADGGSIPERKDLRDKMSDKELKKYRQNNAGATEEAPTRSMRDKINMRPVEGGSRMGNAARAVGRGIGKAAAGYALMAPLANQTADDADARYAQRFGWDEYPRNEDGSIGQEASVPGYLKYLGKRALGYASDVGDMVTGGLAGYFYNDNPHAAQASPPPQAAAGMGGAAQAPASPQRMALSTMEVRAKPAARAAVRSDPEHVDFSQMDIDPHEVPDMKTDDWKRYRAELMDAARQSGRPDQVEKVNDMVTNMQQKGFMNYAQQGLALQQAGNIRGAMSAYRAAYQYFPNGHDVEFGVHKGKIVGFGKDEKTGKVVPGTELVMDPERVAVLIENFKNPQAFRMWTTDWRDFHQKERQYQEVTKPLAQAQANALENRSEADVLRAENAQLKAGQTPGAGAGLRNAEHVFRERVGMLGIQDEAQADYLASVMSQIKVANPNVPDNAIVQAIMQANRDGTLKQRLQQLGIQ